MSLLRSKQIELWVEARDGQPAVNPVMQLLLDGLTAYDALCTIRVPELEVFDADQVPAEDPPDLILLKSATDLALSMAVAQEISGTRFLNSAQATWRGHDKAATIARLAAAGLPVPVSFLLDSSVAQDVDSPSSELEWVTKPTRGIHGRGVVVHPVGRRTLSVPKSVPGAELVRDDGTRLLQLRIGGDEPDVKVYVVGDGCYAGRKRFSAESYATDGITPLELDAGTREIVLEVGQALGLRLYGVDLRFEDNRPFIIDANPFPGYRGFPSAAETLRAEITQTLEDAV